MNYDFDLYSPLSIHDEDEPCPWLGDLLIAVAIVAVCSVVYFWGVA